MKYKCTNPKHTRISTKRFKKYCLKKNGWCCKWLFFLSKGQWISYKEYQKEQEGKNASSMPSVPFSNVKRRRRKVFCLHELQSEVLNLPYNGNYYRKH